ncbi:GH92 family glycosyl hydrolase [Paenibacillus sp. Marseille-Q4541]|uniref:GH92 family glycosyl hydrolase n=1 Tax=Paenibacillus sp. Marseille-Q4541 TaxID=2831522 RepID=UPI001BA81A90
MGKRIHYVNTLQGTDSTYPFSNGNTLPLTGMPFGAGAWTLQTNEAGGGWFFSPHHNRLEGIRYTHQPSPWIGDYGHMVFMPQTGPLKLGAMERSSSIRLGDLVTRPDYISTHLLRYQTQFELVPTERCAKIRLTFSDLEAAKTARFICAPFVGESAFTIDSKQGLITGYTTAKAGDTPVHLKQYFVIRFDCPVVEQESSCFTAQFKPVSTNAQDAKGERVGAYAGLEVPEDGIVHVSVATSLISIEQAWINMERELGEQSFADIAQQAEERWEKQLGVIEVETAGVNEQEDERNLRTFYSSLYRTSLFPHAIHEYDADGKKVHYSPYNGKIEDGPLYADIGFWDTYRTSFPLYSLLYPTFMSEMMEGWVNAYKEGGWMPKWVSPGERSSMPGTLIDVSFADAVMKGITNFDLESAFEGLYKHAVTPPPHPGLGRKGLTEYLEYGYLPADIHTHESVCNTLDYAYGDFCIAQIAKVLGKTEEYEMLMERSRNYQLLFDQEIGFMRGKQSDGSWITPFDAYEWGGPYCEGGPWQSSFAVQHDLLGLAGLYGGKEEMKKQLDLLFTSPPVFKVGSYGFEIHEMSEMAAVDFGQFAISNQPSFHLPYIYTALGYPEEANYWVRKAMDELFSAETSGFPGDEDNGSMAAWYLFGAMGFYPLSPGVPEYVLGSPLFAKMTVHLEDGNTLVIRSLPEAGSESAEAVHVSQIQMNEEQVESLSISHDVLKVGGELTFTKSASSPQKTWKESQLPYSMSKEKDSISIK